MSKTILITGTSTGFGKLLTESLSAAGYQLIATMRGTDAKNAEVAKQLASLPGVDVVELDVTDDNSVSKAMASIAARYSKIDVLINNAGVAGGGVFEAYTIDDIRQMFEINVFGVVKMYQAVLPLMRSHKEGLIINMSSLVGHFAMPYFVPYSATKFALEALNEGLQKELQQFGIDNVSLVIGAHPTEMNNGVKSGVNAGYESIIGEYGQTAQTGLQATAQFIADNMHRNDPQILLDIVLDLIQQKNGTRPLRVPVDVIAEGADKAFLEALSPLKRSWAEKYRLNLPA
jgi:short-subunit dehydrogenase